MKKVAINGFGRIWRLALRTYFENFDNADIEIVAINDPSGTEVSAHLFEFDSNYWRFKWEVSHWEDFLKINWKKIASFSDRDPLNLPWKDLWVDIVLECTWFFCDKEWASKHIKSWAKKVIISAPWKWCIDWTFVYWVNHEDYDSEKHTIISNASCTTNCLAPVAKVINDEFWIKNALMNTIHSYTWDQRLLDSSHKDLRRARNACDSIIPTKTWAAKAVSLVIPELEWKVDWFALRVPTSTVSCVDLAFETEKEISLESLNWVLKKASEWKLKWILWFESRPLVSIDYRWDTDSSIIDSALTRVMWNNFWKIIAWYDNEYGYATRLLDMANYISSK